MLETVRRLSLGLLLLALAAGVLLYTDRGSRRSAQKGGTQRGPIRVAVVQHASLDVLEQGAEGILEGLAQRGYADGARLHIRRYNAEGDISTANAIAKEVTSGSFDLLLSVSTISLQTLANANKVGARTPHVFGLVTDPYGAGVGIERTNHLIHPPYLAGAGSLQPIEDLLRTARRMRPDLKSVGLVWNAAEANSLAQTRIARQVCSNLNLALIEANAENSAAVLESANAVIARGAEALWISGDVAVSLATDQVINAARRARIPVFSSLPGAVLKGALFDLGANYVDIGRHVGQIAADVLDGKNPADMPIDNVMTALFLYNETVLPNLRDRWEIPPDLRQSAAGRITATSTNLPQLSVPKKQARLQPQPGRTYRIGLVYFAPEAAGDSCRQGLLDGLRDLGFVEGKNLEVRRSHAQAEIANIPALLQNLDSSDVDVVVPMSTPVISGACSLIKRKPVVFTYCSDPLAAGVGSSFSNHLPHVTGIGSFPPVEDMVKVIRQSLPRAKSVGTVYNASEANSVKVVSVARGLFAQAGLQLVEATVSSSADLLQAAQSLAARGVDAIYVEGDNTVAQGFEAVLKAAQDARLPLFVDDPDEARRGAVACVGLGYYRPGYVAAQPLARVLLGESPARIPIENVTEKTVWFDPVKAATYGIQFPPALLAQATPAKTNAPPAPAPAPAPDRPLGRLAKVNLVEYLETPNVELNREGIRAGLAKAGLKEGRDIELRVRNAQGDMATLNTMMDATASDGSELLIVSTTPALQAAVQRAARRNVVFSLVANPMLSGAGRSPEEHLPNVTGAYIPAPHDEGIAALRRCLPRVRRIGTLFVPAEVNSVYYKDDLLRAARAAGIEVETVGVSNSGEIADAAMALCSRRIDAVCQISDNLTGASFASIAQAARRARLPLFGFATGQAKSGAFMTLSRDFHDGGIASGEIAARLLRGESPARIPFLKVEKIRYTFNPAAAAASGITLPPDLLQLGDIVQ
ncbi:MAG: hypothetical protein RJA22_2094 [Verrucomicrobiota bacterium]